MKKKKIYKPYRRKEQTDYGKRLSMLKSGLPRLVVRLSNKNIVMQIAEYQQNGDKMLYAVSSKELEKKGWKGTRNSSPAAYLVGLMLAKATDGKIKEAILDIGKRKSVKQSKIYAGVKGVVDGGIDMHADDSVYPDESRINGKHISEYAAKLAKENKEKYTKYYSKYLKNNIRPEDLTKHFEEIKAKI